MTKTREILAGTTLVLAAASIGATAIHGIEERHRYGETMSEAQVVTSDLLGLGDIINAVPYIAHTSGNSSTLLSRGVVELPNRHAEQVELRVQHVAEGRTEYVLGHVSGNNFVQTIEIADRAPDAPGDKLTDSNRFAIIATPENGSAMPLFFPKPALRPSQRKDLQSVLDLARYEIQALDASI